MEKLKRRFARASAPAPGPRGAPAAFACFTRASSPPPVRRTQRASPTPPMQQASPPPAPASPFAVALERVSAALQPGSSQLGDVEFEGEEEGEGRGDPTPASVARPPSSSTPGAPVTPTPGPDAPPAPTTSASPRHVPTPLAGPVVEVEAEAPPPSRGTLAAAIGTPAPALSQQPPAHAVPVVEVEEAPAVEPSHPRTDALPVAPVTIEVLARALGDAAVAAYGAALAALGARNAREAAAVLVRAARTALWARVSPALASASTVVHTYAPGVVSKASTAARTVKRSTVRAWEAAVRWWAVAVEHAELDDSLASDESTAGSAPRFSEAGGGGEEEITAVDWEAVPPPERAVGWVARE